MRKILIVHRRAALLLAGLMLLAQPLRAEPPPRAETMAEKTLKEIVARQRDIFAKAGKEGDQLDEAGLRGDLEGVVKSYDVLIQKNPDFAAAFVAYAQLLAKVGMTREAVALYLKANKLDAEIPFVKNELARLLAEDGKMVDALPWLMAAIDLEPREPLYHYHLGMLLTEGRDDFLRTGQFTRPALDKAMIEAFQKAAELAPTNFAYTYRAAEAYYDLETPRWDEALKVWGAIEEKAAPGLEKETIRLHAVNVLIKQGRPGHARALLVTVTDPKLAGQKQTLLDQLAKAGEK